MALPKTEKKDRNSVGMLTDFSSLFEGKIGKIVHCADAAAIAIIDDELGRK